MRNTGLSRQTRRAIAHSRIFLCLVTPRWLTDRHVQAQAAYARSLGKPFRLLVWPGVRLAEDALAGVWDLATAPHTTAEEDAEQIRRWLEAARGGEDQPCSP